MVLFRNNFLISRSVPFGRNYSLRCLLMPLHVSSIPRHATDGFEIQWHFRAFSRGKNLLFFLKKRIVRSCLISAPWSTVPVAAELWSFIAQLVEHRTGIAGVTGSNPVEALIFFQLLLSNCWNWKFSAMITLHIHCICICFAQREYDLHFYVKRDCLLFSVNVKLFSEFFVIREKANYFCVKLFSVFSGEVKGTLCSDKSFTRCSCPEIPRY